MTQILGEEEQGLVFEIVSARISDVESEKRHVIYTVQIRYVSGNDDLSPSVIERRYTQFLNLYSALKNEHPQLMTKIYFPRKVIMGNFDNDLISVRSTGFQTFLKHVSSDPKLKSSKALLDFLQNPEMERAKNFIEKKEFSEALPLLENNFKLLNKIFTDRSPAVLIALCKLLGCCMSIPGYLQTQKWADLALHRYESVSDGDLLKLYVPLLNACIQICLEFGTSKEGIEQRLRELKQQGLTIRNSNSLLDEVDVVEGKIFRSSSQS